MNMRKRIPTACAFTAEILTDMHGDTMTTDIPSSPTTQECVKYSDTPKEVPEDSRCRKKKSQIQKLDDDAMTVPAFPGSCRGARLSSKMPEAELQAFFLSYVTK